MSGRDPDAVARDAEKIVRQLGGKWHGDYSQTSTRWRAKSLAIPFGSRMNSALL